MASTNKKTFTVFSEEKLAGGFGNRAAKQNYESDLNRLVLTCLLWEDNAYIDGNSIASQIAELVPKVNPEFVANLAVRARFEQKLRHIPLFLCREMAKYETHKPFVSSTLFKVIHRPDELSEFLSLYWKDNKRKTISAQVKKGLAAAFHKFNEYQLAKFNRDKDVKLKDVIKLCHPKPENEEQAALWKRLLNDELQTPDTWEVSYSKCKTTEEKKDVWERLIEEGKLGSFAFLKNLRNMISVGVNPKVIRNGLANLKQDMLLPIDFLKAQKFAPDYTRELENAMFSCAKKYKKLSGKTILVVDVSGSMAQQISSKSDFKRLDAAIAMTILVSEICENISIYVTAGSDSLRIHKTEKIKPYKGFALGDEILSKAENMGGGGIFTKQCINFIREKEKEDPDRIIVFSDSQDCDIDKSLPNPFGKKNYIIDVSSHKNGINYKGVWTSEISGWSEGFLSYITEIEN